MRYDAATRVKPLSAVRLRLLSFSTGDVLAQEITRALAAVGLQAEIAQPGFGLVIPELLAPTAEVPDAVVVLLDAAGFFSRDWRQPTEVAQALLRLPSRRPRKPNLLLHMMSQHRPRPGAIATNQRLT